MEVLFGVKSITELKPVDIALAKCENSISSARGVFVQFFYCHKSIWMTMNEWSGSGVSLLLFL